MSFAPASLLGLLFSQHRIGICGCRRHPQCKPVSTLRLELCQPMTPALLPVGERRLRHVAVSWAASGMPLHAYLRMRGTDTKAQGCVEN